jgi:5-formyltetrahydrofolate cyclo-ligase
VKTHKEEDRRKKSQSIKERLFGDSVFKRAKRVMFYISFDGEVDTEEMIKGAQNLGKIVSVPVCRRDSTLRPCMLEKGSVLKDGLYGIPEPVMKKFIRLKDLDLVITPGVAFDKKGNRLGRGRGYYDRFLKRLSPRTAAIGLAFDFQILPALPASKRDTGVSRVIFA